MLKEIKRMPDPLIVAACQNLLRDAEVGRLQSFAAISFMDGEPGVVMAGSFDASAMLKFLGMVTVLQSDMSHQLQQMRKIDTEPPNGSPTNSPTHPAS